MTMRKSYYKMRERLEDIGVSKEASNLVAKQTAWLEKASATEWTQGTKYQAGQYVAGNYAEELQTQIFNFFWGAMAVYEDKLARGLITRDEYDTAVRGINAEISYRIDSLVRSFDEDYGYFAKQDKSMGYSGTANTYYKSRGEGRMYPTPSESIKNMQNSVKQAATKQAATKQAAKAPRKYKRDAKGRFSKYNRDAKGRFKKL